MSLIKSLGISQLVEENELKTPLIIICTFFFGCVYVSSRTLVFVVGNEEIAKLLVQSGAIADPKIYNVFKAMHTYRNVLKQLYDLQRQDSESNSLLHTGFYKLAPLLYLLEEEVDMNAADKQGTTLLHIVCYKGSEHHVKLLLENKADPNKKDVNGLTPLHFAVFKGKFFLTIYIFC